MLPLRVLLFVFLITASPIAANAQTPADSDKAATMGDSTGDGAVNLDDYNQMRSKIGNCAQPGERLPEDRNGNGCVDLDDFNITKNTFGAHKQ